MFGFSSLKLIGMGVGILVLIGLLAMVNDWRVKMIERGEKLAVICQATRDASGQSKLKCSEVPAQIKFMGETITDQSNAIDRQNARVKALGDETARQQAESERASEKAKERADRAEATAERLAASSRAGGTQAKPCEPSKALQESWR